jgi:iron complex transport system substrate-binding protein
MAAGQRIATLLPSATEIVCALGLGDRVVGVSHECDYPPEIVGRPVLTEPKLDPRGTSAEIDAAVRRLVRDGLSVYRIKEEELRTARPDLIVTQEQCEVCAVSYTDVLRAAREWLGHPVEIVSLKPDTLDDIFGDFERVAAAAGVADQGRALVEQGRERLERLRRGAKHVRSRPRVACLEWLDPLMAAGNWVPELIELAGGTYDLAPAGQHSPTLTWERLIEYAPDVVVLMPCGFKLEQTRRELPGLVARPEWHALPAVRNGRAYSVDGNAYLNRPGPRIVDSAELLAGLIQPGHFASLIPEGSWERVASDGRRVARK